MPTRPVDRELLTHALDHGLYYWDTAHDYVYDGIVSEERLGKLVRGRSATTKEPFEVSDGSVYGLT